MMIVQIHLTRHVVQHVVRSPLATILLLWFIVPALSCASPPTLLTDTHFYHTDTRDSPKLIVHENYAADATMTGRELADHYLLRNAATFQFAKGADTLTFVKAKTSLLASHYHYQQYLNGIPVEHAEIIVSVAKKTNTVSQVFNSTFPQPSPLSLPQVLLSQEEILDRAWHHLHVHGDLLAIPEANLLYINDKGKFRLVYKVQIQVTAPYGYWEIKADAQTGEILSVGTSTIERNPKGRHELRKIFSGDTWNRQEVIERFLHVKEKKRKK